MHILKKIALLKLETSIIGSKNITIFALHHKKVLTLIRATTVGQNAYPQKDSIIKVGDLYHNSAKL